MEGSNIINFSDFVDEIINTNIINDMMNLLGSDNFINMNNIRFLLSKYYNQIKLFNKEFEKVKRESIFEFS